MCIGLVLPYNMAHVSRIADVHALAAYCLHVAHILAFARTSLKGVCGMYVSQAKH